MLLLLFAFHNFVRTLRLKRSATRLGLIEERVHAIGTWVSEQTGDTLVRQASTHVDVSYTISGKTYRCRRHELFRGSDHGADLRRIAVFGGRDRQSLNPMVAKFR